MQVQVGARSLEGGTWMLTLGKVLRSVCGCYEPRGKHPHKTSKQTIDAIFGVQSESRQQSKGESSSVVQAL